LFIKGIIIGLAVSVPLGPIGMLCVQRTLGKGFRAGMMSGLGAALADTLYAILAGFGLQIISDFLLTHQAVFRIVGSFFLLYVGIKIFFTNPAVQLRKYRNQKSGNVGDTLSVFLLTLSNPLTMLAFSAIYAGMNIISTDTSQTMTVLITSGIFTGCIVWWLSLVMLVNVFRGKIRLRKMLYLNKISGFIIGIIGIITALSIFRL